MSFETQIEFDKIKDIWAELVLTEAAKEQIAQMTFLLNETELRKALQDTTNAREMIEKLGTPPLQNLSEMKEILTIAEKGDRLNPYQLERVQKVLVIVERLKSYLGRGKQFENPLAYYDENLYEEKELREEIERRIRNEAVDDHATATLYNLRLAIMRCEEQMKQKAEMIIRNNKEAMADNYITVRNGRICVPVKKEYKFKIPGVTIDKSATGSTVFIEPTGVYKYYEELQLLRIDEENEIYNILYTLTAMVAESAAAFRENITMMERLDFMFSKGKLSLELKCSEPKINLERRIRLTDARHPLMDPDVNVPLQFEIGEKFRGIVITGPNTGGKTVAIKTVMLNCLMAQCGLHVTCGDADVCMNNDYLCDIGDGQNLSENLSTFSAHIKNVLEVLAKVSKESFVIMDELGSGTDPTEGMGIAVAILEELRESGANFLVTTHYPEIKEYANRTEDIVNARMTFDKESLMPTYHMVIGEAGESCAFYIADRLGMPASMLRRAVTAAYGEQAAEQFRFHHEEAMMREAKSKIKKTKKPVNTMAKLPVYNVGDSVMIYPDKKIGIVCIPVNEKGVLRVQLPGKKIWINHKRVKLHVKAEELYPEDYDFSIIFDSVANRKARHDMERKYTEEIIRTEN